MAEAKKEKWLGGYSRVGVRGRTFVIERWIDGVHWHVSTKCRTERAALKELEKFEADPRGYRKARSAKTQSAAMTPELIAEYLADMERRDLDPPYIKQHKVYLGQVMVQLAGADLARTTFIELREAIERCGSPDFPGATRARQRAIKSFCKWMRREKGLLNRQNDPSLDLAVSHAIPEKNRRTKAMDLEVVEKTIALMPPDVADFAIVLAATGLHVRELQRLHEGQGGLYEPAEWQRTEGVVLVLVVLHKRGTKHAVAITDPAAADAARRLMARKECPTKGRMSKQVKLINAKTGLKFSMGWLRHSVATWLAKKRVPEQDIANQLGHADTKMVRSTYIDLGIGAHPVPIPRLRVVKS